jgi:prevent-host-death family protein
VDVAEIGVKELKATASAVIEKVEAGTTYVITKRGRPAAVLLPVEDAEDAVLANADEYVRMRRVARDDHRLGRTVSLGDLD